MVENKLSSVVPALEIAAAKNPGQYKFRVALVAALGYAYLLFIVALLLTIIVVVLLVVSFNFITLKLLWIPLVIVGIVLRSLWIKLPVPDGAEIQREQAPALFDLIHEVTTTLNGPSVHHVLISAEFNASIVQIPQFGMFGWLRNYLVVGLPLLRAISPSEFRAVLAHEVGHLSGKHGRFSGWIYRLRRSWVEVLQRIHFERHYASFLFEPFVNWYAPYLNAYSFVLARAQERQADAYAVELAGKEVAASMLIRFEVKEAQLRETFWPAFFQKSKEEPRAPFDPFEQMLGGLDKPVGAMNTQKWFFEALQVPTGYDDTHPALSDRLAAIGYPKDSPQVTSLLEAVLAVENQDGSAATHYLRELPSDFLARENRLIREQLVQAWNENHVKAKEARQQFQKMEEQATKRELTPDEQWERVKLLAQVENNEAALPSLRTIIKENPDHANAHFAIGAILLEQNDPDGVEHLKRASELKHEFGADACTLLAGFYLQQGNRELAESFRRDAAVYYEREQERQERILRFSADDKYLEHDLSTDQLDEIVAQLNRVRGLSEAYLFRKVIDDDYSVYVLAFFAAYTWREGQSDKHIGPLVEELASINNLPTPLVFLALDVNLETLPRIQEIPNVLIYKRG